MGKIQRSFALMKASWEVLKTHRSLAVLPLVSMIATLLGAAIFIGPVMATTSTSDLENHSFAPWQWALIAVGYFVTSYIAVFFMTALVAAADLAMRGGTPTVGWALRQAAARAGQILPWVLITTTVGLLLRALQERLGFPGAIVAGLAGLAWTVVSMLVIPLMVIENLTAKDALRRSTALVKRSWGENVVGNVGIGLAVSIIGGIPFFIVAMIGAVVLAGGSIVAGLAIIALALVWFIAVAVIGSALTGVYQVALYAYAAHGAVPQQFAQADLPHAFEPKKSRWR